MDQLSSGLHGVALLLDDLLISGANAEQHLQNLHSLLQHSQDKGLRCSLEKCCFAQLLVEYLDYTLSQNSISKGHKVNAITKMPPPTAVPALSSFLDSAVRQQVHTEPFSTD